MVTAPCYELVYSVECTTSWLWHQRSQSIDKWKSGAERYRVTSEDIDSYVTYTLHVMYKIFKVWEVDYRVLVSYSENGQFVLVRPCPVKVFVSSFFKLPDFGISLYFYMLQLYFFILCDLFLNSHSCFYHSFNLHVLYCFYISLKFYKIRYGTVPIKCISMRSAISNFVIAL